MTDQDKTNEDNVRKESTSSDQDLKKETKKTKKTRPPRIFIWGIVFGVVIIILGVIAFGAVRIYKYQSDDSFTTNLSKIIPYPAAMVDGQFVSYNEVKSMTDTLTNFMEYQAALFPDNNLYDAPPYKELFSDTLGQLIENTFIETQARKRQVKVSDAEIDAEMQKLSEEAALAGENMEAVLKERYNWTADQFGQKVIYPQLIQNKLALAITLDETIEVNKQAKEKIDEAYQKIVNEEITFAEGAEQYSEDETTVATGGDLGSADPNYYVDEFRDALIALEDGEISQPVSTYYGWHIIELVGKETGENGETLYHARHILIKTQPFEEWLIEKLGEAKIRKFVD